MKRILVAIAAVVTVSVSALPSPAHASGVGCRYTVMDPVTGDGQLSSGPLYGGDPLGDAYVRCQFHLDGPDGPVLRHWYANIHGPVVMMPPFMMTWNGTRGDIHLCTAVMTRPYHTAWIDRGCSYSFTY